jgi:uncharacterized protein (TIGR00369 family)
MIPNITHIDFSGSGSTLRRIWETLASVPGGKRLFSRVLGLINPYTGALGAEIVELGPGRCRARLRERRAIQNHVRSIHAIALINLAEVTSGLALMAGLPDDARGLPVHLEIDYHKKARGVITAECDCAPPVDNREQAIALTCSMANAEGEVVATARARWAVGPKR